LTDRQADERREPGIQRRKLETSGPRDRGQKLLTMIQPGDIIITSKLDHDPLRRLPGAL
jgi:hypothetical protein